MANGNYYEPPGGLLREVMDAHGGVSTWHGAETVRVVMSTGGFLFLMRTTRDAFRRTEVVVHLRSPRTVLKEFPRAGCTGFFEPDRVWIQDGTGPWNGLYLYSPDTAPSLGDLVEEWIATA